MKKLTVCTIIILILTLFGGCVSESNYDLNEFIKVLNINEEYNLSSADFTVNREENIVYSKTLSKDVLLRIYADENNEIIQCTVSTIKSNKEKYYKICTDIGKTLLRINYKECSEIINKVKKSDKAELNGWLFTEIKTQEGSTLIINRKTDPINTNTLPSIKEKIEEKDITRPTLAKDN